MTQNPFLNIVESLLRKNNIAFDKKELFLQIQSHPSYPSLHSITGVLDHLNIENVAANVSVNMDTLAELPATFIAQVNTEKGTDLVLVSRKKTQYHVTPSIDSTKSLNANGFLEVFTGIIVAVEKGEVTEKRQAYSWLTKSLWAVPFLALFILGNPSLNTIIFFLLSIAGAVVSVTIIKQELGQKTSLGDAFCSSVSEKKDCDAVLSSKGAQLLGAFKVSDLSLVYFISITLGTLLSSTSSQSSYIIHYLSIIALPVTLYSIYYQWRVVKKWCLMCLSIVGVLWAQAALSYFTIGSELSIQANELLSLSMVLLTVFALWNHFRPQYEEQLKSEKTKLDFYKFKRNFNLFSTLLEQAQRLDTQISGQEILLGNHESNTEIVIVTSPFCGHCKPVHKLVEDILLQHGSNVRVLIRFNIKVNDPDSDIARVTTRLLELYHVNGPSECLQAMTDIYGSMSSEEWLSKWSDCTNQNAFLQILEDQRRWCTTNQINFTPHLMINGRAFPNVYERQDLILFLEEFNEQQSSLSEERTNQSILEMSL